MRELKILNKKALEFALNVVPKMRELSKPLRDNFGISSFSYMRTYPDCKYLSLLDGHEEYSKKFFETIPKSDQHFIDAIQNASFGEPTFSLWPTNPKILTPILSLLDAYNIWHGFQITYRREQYCEMFSFTFNKQTDDKSEFYIKNIPILLKFIEFFRSNASDIISGDDIALAVFPEKFDTSFKSNITNLQFYDDINNAILLRKEDQDKVHLTNREKECLKILAKNKTCKEIGRILNISPRTVELHIHNVKQKLNINYKSQLIDFFENNLYY